MAAHQGLLERRHMFRILLNMCRQYEEAEKLLDHHGMILASTQLGTSRRVRVRQAFEKGEITKAQFDLIK